MWSFRVVIFHSRLNFNFFQLYYHLLGTDQDEDILCCEFIDNPKWMMYDILFNFVSIHLRWLDTVFKNSGVQHFDMFKLRIFRIYSADIGFFIYFDNSTFKLY